MLLLKNKTKEIQNSQSNKAGNTSITPKDRAVLQPEGRRGQVIADVIDTEKPPRGGWYGY